MITAVVGLYTLYILLSLYMSVMQIGYVNQAKRKKAVLLSPSEFLKAGNYAVEKEKLSIVQHFVDYLLFVAWIGFGIALLQKNMVFESEAVANIALVMGFVVINAVFSLPFSYYEKFVLDQKYGFNKSSFALFVKDTLITFVMTLIFGSLVVWGIYAIMSSFTLWWVWSFVFIFGVVILINMLFPTFRALFFDKLKPLENEELKSEIQALMDKTGFVSSGVFISDASKRDARLNAYFGGLGKTKRVVLFDTLIEKLTTKELLAVLGHELGHFAHGDLYKNIAMVGVMLLGMFALFGNLPASLYLELGLSESPALVMILLLLFMPVLGFIMMPLMGILSRHNEYEADKTGSSLAGKGGEIELANALQKLVSENKSFPLSHPVYIFFHYTHPPVLERLKALGMDIETHEKSSLEGTCQAHL